MANIARKVCAALAFLMCVQSSGILAEETAQEPEHTTHSAETRTPEPAKQESKPAEEQSQQTAAPTPVPTPTPSPTPSPTPVPQAQNTPAPEAGEAVVESPEETAGSENTPEATADASESVAPVNTATPEAEYIEPGETATDGPEVTPVPITEDQAEEEVTDSDEVVFVRHNKNPGFYGAVPSDSRGMQIPLLFQGSYPEIVCYVGGTPRSVATSGCGATSLSMVIAYLTGNTDQTPYSLFCEAVDSGRYHGSGLDHGTLSSIGSAYGVKSKWIANNADAIIEALKAGKPVIAHMGPGLFTDFGHYIVLRGVTEDGMILVNDPNSAKLSRYAYPIDTFIKQARGGSSFMVCWSENTSIATETSQGTEPEEVEEIIDVAEETEPEEVEETVEAAEEPEEVPETVEATETEKPVQVTVVSVHETEAPADPEPEVVEETEAPEESEPEATEETDVAESEAVAEEPSATAQPESVVRVVVHSPTIPEEEAPAEDAEVEAATVPQEEFEAFYARTVRDHVLIRGRAGTGGRVVATLVEADVRLKVLESVENGPKESWYKVFYEEESVFGYVRSDLVKRDDGEQATVAMEESEETAAAAVEVATQEEKAEEQQAQLIITPVDFENRTMVTRYDRVGIYKETDDRLKPLVMISDAGTEVLITDILLDEHGSVWYYAVYNDVEGYIRASMLAVPTEAETTEEEPVITAEEEPVLTDTVVEEAETVQDEPEAEIEAPETEEVVADEITEIEE